MTFTEKYFFEEIRRFRDAFGNKEWWKKSEEQRDAWISGLSLVYLNINNEDGTNPTKEQINKWATIFQVTVEEYERRKLFMLMHALKVGA